MAQTFDIRFARSAGLAALLEAPENRFRWKGVGLLRIDAQSISFTVKRGLLALFAGNRTRRIPAGNLKAVYREGDALRVEFQADEAAREVLPFWASDRDAAAEIVRLLPTSQTVEIEHITGATRSGKPRADWRVLLSLTALVAIAGGACMVYLRADLPPATASEPAVPVDSAIPGAAPSATPSSGDTRAPQLASTTSSATPPGSQRVEAPAFPLDASRPRLPTKPESLAPRNASSRALERDSPLASVSTPSAVASTGEENQPARRARVTADGVVPILPGMPAYHAAWRQLDLFMAESDVLWGYYLDARYSGNSQRLTEIEGLWWKVTVRVSNSRDFEDPSLRHLQEIELAVSRAWRMALSLRKDPALVASADAEAEFAEMLRARARQFVE